jgi:hypothetical protein
MVELIGDPCIPSELIIPAIANASLPSAPRKGLTYYDETNNKLVFWNGTAFETVTSSA